MANMPPTEEKKPGPEPGKPAETKPTETKPTEQEERQYRCIQCGTSFNVKTELDQHNMTAHPAKAPGGEVPVGSGSGPGK